MTKTTGLQPRLPASTQRSRLSDKGVSHLLYIIASLRRPAHCIPLSPLARRNYLICRYCIYHGVEKATLACASRTAFVDKCTASYFWLHTGLARTEQDLLHCLYMAAFSGWKGKNDMCIEEGGISLLLLLFGRHLASETYKASHLLLTDTHERETRSWVASCLLLILRFGGIWVYTRRGKE